MLQVSSPVNPAAAPPAHSTLQLWLARLVATCAEELCSFATMKSQALWAAPPAPQQQQQQCSSELGSMEPQDAVASVATALLAVDCLAGGLALLARAAAGSGQQGLGPDACADAPSAAQRLAATLEQSLRDFAGCHEAAGGPALPPASSDLAAARLECLAACLRGLAAAQPLLAPVPAPAARASRLLPLLLSLHQQQELASGVAPVRLRRLWWQAADSLLGLLSGGAAWPQAAGPRDGSDSGLPDWVAAAERLCGGVGEEAAGRLLAVAIASLGAAHRTYLIAVLRCIRCANACRT